MTGDGSHRPVSGRRFRVLCKIIATKVEAERG